MKVQVINLPADDSRDLLETLDLYCAQFPESDVELDCDVDDGSVTVYVTKRRLRA